MADNYFKGAWNTGKRNARHVQKFVSQGDRICLYDLGASGGVPPPFCWIPEGIQLVNFEPDARATTDASGKKCDVAIGPETMGTLYLNRRQTTSSLLPPCEAVVNRYDFSGIFPEEPRIFETVATAKVQTIGLDEAVREMQLSAPDFLKIDVQGLTYEVLQTGSGALKDSVIGLQAEVEFVETYRGQKTFGAVHEYLEKMGFEMFRLMNLNHWTYKTAMPLKMYSGQDVFCDLLYLRSLRDVERHPEFWTSRRIVQFLKICLLYDLTDAAAAYLERFVQRELIEASAVEELAELIRNWTGAEDYFYPGGERDKEQGRSRQIRQACAMLLKAVLPLRLVDSLRALRRA